MTDRPPAAWNAVNTDLDCARSSGLPQSGTTTGSPYGGLG